MGCEEINYITVERENVKALFLTDSNEHLRILMVETNSKCNVGKLLGFIQSICME